MKLIPPFLTVSILLFLIQGCNEPTEMVLSNEPNSIDTINMGCLETYNKNPEDTNEKINQVYGKGKIKHGHWISFGVTVTKTVNDKAIQSKIEEGYYKFNKKIGFWKYYKADGTLKDSIEYKNDIPITKS